MCVCVRLCACVEPRQQNKARQRDTKIASNVFFIIYH